MGTRAKWTPEEDKQLLELYQRRYKLFRIARILGKTYNQVAYRISVLGGRPKATWTQQEDTLLIALFLQHKTDKEIAKVLTAHSKESISVRRQYLGYTRKGRNAYVFEQKQQNTRSAGT